MNKIKVGRWNVNYDGQDSNLIQNEVDTIFKSLDEKGFTTEVTKKEHVASTIYRILCSKSNVEFQIWFNTGFPTFSLTSIDTINLFSSGEHDQFYENVNLFDALKFLNKKLEALQ